MKAVVKTKPEPGVEILEKEMPVGGDNDVLVKLTAGSLCGSDVHMYEWTAGYEFIPMPMILGHEFAGKVVEVGAKVRGLAVGDRVTAMPLFTCGKCPACVTGRSSDCEKTYLMGLRSDGAFADYLLIRGTAEFLKIPETVSDEKASLIEPLAISMKSIDLSGIKPGQTAAVLGPGPIGLLIIQLLKAAGAGLIIVTGTSGDEVRMELAVQMGADIVINVDREDPVKKVKELNGGLDHVFEATGIAPTINQGLQMVKKGGKVLVVGIHKDHATFDTIELVRQQKSLIGVYAYDREIWQRCLTLMASGKIDPTPIITHRLPLSAAVEAFELAISKAAAKVMFVPEI